ncbi:uncharacterized protein OCT59_003530 [Rhizophagus irregularis]|uniref:uncharacterized protein n=1 Tax=Rhizophagus irregularis TaxID=588596 RepID=UPI003331DE63|nr:hypothetical protein OCT59_003530 [Rhizophagus irregularis]
MWTDDEVRMLIDERKEGNDHYHSLGGGVVRERGGPQPLQKSTRDTELLIQGARLLKNSMASITTATVTTDQLRSQQQQQQQHQQNSDHPDQDQKLRSLEDQKVVQIFDELLRSQQQQQDQQVVQVFDDELEREDSSQASQSSLAIWEIDDD